MFKLVKDRINFFFLQDFTSFKNLKVLDLSENNFMGSIPPAIGNLSSIIALSLAHNGLNGTLPNQGKTKFMDHIHVFQNMSLFKYIYYAIDLNL